MTASSPMPAVDAAVAEVSSLRRLLKKTTQQQVRSKEELSAIKATAHAWFQSHKRSLNLADPTTLATVDVDLHEVNGGGGYPR